MTTASKTLNQIVVCITATLLLTQTKAQNDNPCSQSKSWNEWKELGGSCSNPPCGAAIRFKNGACTNSNNVCGVGLQWEYHNDVAVKDAYYRINIQYKTCSGRTGQLELKMDLSQTGKWQPTGSYTSDGGTELLNMQAQLVNPDKDRAKLLSDDVNTIATNYNKQYEDAIAAANKVKGSAQHNQLIQQINANKDLFHQYKQQAQDELNNSYGDAMAQTLDKMKQQLNDLHTIYLRIDPDEPTITKNNATVNNTSTPVKITVAQTNTNNNQQQEIRQQIIQGQQEMQTKTNQTISNSVQQGTDAVTNYTNFIANENAKKEQAQVAYDERMQRVNQTMQKERASRDLSGFEALKEAANKGDSNAMLSLAVIYRKGNDAISVNMQQSVIWYQKAAEQGKVEAQVFLCNLYYYGSSFYFKGGDTVKDHTKSLYWGEKSLYKGYVVEREFMQPEYILGNLYVEKARKNYENNNSDEAVLNYRKVITLSGDGLENTDRKYLAKLILKNKITIQEIENSSTSLSQSRYLLLIQSIYFTLANSYQSGEDTIIDNPQAILFYQKVIDLKNSFPKYEWLKKGDIPELAKKRLKELKKAN